MFEGPAGCEQNGKTGHELSIGAAELILGEARFIAPQTLEVTLQNGSVRVLVGERVVILVPFLLLVAWAAYAFWDEPIRTRLKARLLGRH